MARTPWAKDEYISSSEIAGIVNQKGLNAAVSVANHWTIDDVRMEMGSEKHANRNLAQKILEYKGIDADPRTPEGKRAIDSQMRSIQRWLNYEKGVTGKQAHKPSPAMQRIINDIGRESAHGGQGATVHVSGDVSVNHYRREGGRAMDIHLSPEQAAAFMNNPTFGGLAAAYGVSEFHAFGDASIEVNWDE